MIPKATWVLRKGSISVVAVREFESDRQDFGKNTPGQILARMPHGAPVKGVSLKAYIPHWID